MIISPSWHVGLKFYILYLRHSLEFGILWTMTENTWIAGRWKIGLRWSRRSSENGWIWKGFSLQRHRLKRKSRPSGKMSCKLHALFVCSLAYSCIIGVLACSDIMVRVIYYNSWQTLRLSSRLCDYVQFMSNSIPLTWGSVRLQRAPTEQLSSILAPGSLSAHYTF
jgi:hypothetical protein